MSNKQRMTIQVISKDEGLSLIKNQASISGPGIIINSEGKLALDLAVTTDVINIEDVANNDKNNDIVNTDSGYQVKMKQDTPSKTIIDKLEKSGLKSKSSGKNLLKNKGAINIPKLK